MGLLDDAIREHLDLKRRRGADPAEIERSEREALGPVRRNREPVAESAEALAPASALVEPDEGVAADLVDEELDDGRGGYDDDPGFFAEDDGPFVEDREPLVRADREPLAPEAGSGLSEHTAEYDVEDALVSDRDAPPHDAPEGEDDVLEETPEFLQDTPDHDRLWFEQRPPRDFDFDG